MVSGPNQDNLMTIQRCRTVPRQSCRSVCIQLSPQHASDTCLAHYLTQSCGSTANMRCNSLWLAAHKVGYVK